MRNIINRHFKVQRNDGTIKEFVLLQDNGQFKSVCYDYLDSHGCTTKALTGHELSISDTLEECKAKTRRLVLVKEIIENQNVTENEAEQILDFGEIRVTSAELIEAINSKDTERVRALFAKLSEEVTA